MPWWGAPPPRSVQDALEMTAYPGPMASVSLRTQLARLEQPIEVDAVESEVTAAQRAVEQQLGGLREGIRDAVLELAEVAADVRSRSESVARIDARTSGGILGTLLSSVDNEGVEQTRAQAASSLAGSLAVLDDRIGSARAYEEHVKELAGDARYGEKALQALRKRAVGGGLDGAVVDRIARAADAVGAVPGQIRRLPDPLHDPLLAAAVVAEKAADILTQLRSGARASTVGEAVLDTVLPGGPVGKALRAGGGWSDERDHERPTAEEVEAQIGATRDSVRERARRDAEAKRAAMAELDDLDDW